MTAKNPRMAMGLLAFLAVAAACPRPAWTAEGGSLTVAAAASLQPVFREIGRLFSAGAEGGGAIFVFGASGSLARQMEHGAPYDVLVSAEERWVAALAEKGIIESASVAPYARGRLALVLFRARGFRDPGKPIGKAGLGRLAAEGVRHIALANPTHAPYGAAAREVLRNVGLWRALEAKLVYGENVRQALTFVETGNAEAGLVAESIAGSSRLTWLPVDDGLHRPIRQALGIRAATRHRAEAERFVALLTGSDGRRILSGFGLVPLPERRIGGRR